MTRSVACAITTLKVMARPDDRDWYALPQPDPAWLDGLTARLAGLRIAYAPVLGGIGADSEVRGVVDPVIDMLRAHGADITEVGSITSELRPRFEAYWYAAFARRLRLIGEERWGELDPTFLEVAKRGLSLSVDQILDGEAARAALGREFQAFHRDYDLLLTPATPHVAPAVETIYHCQAYDRWRDSVAFSLPFNLTGQPAASVPCGLSSRSLPVGLQVVGPKYSERLILEACLAIEHLIDLPVPHSALVQSLQSMV
jgi:aspartyl-tRNA(Asn)/glutamyl-tRNA(Gln) amidotransferase subunit A